MGLGRTAARGARLLGALAAAAALLLLPASALAHGKSHHRNHHDGDGGHGNAPPAAVYTASNDPNGNAVIVYSRNANGTITQTGSVPTGGTGIASEPPFGFPIVDSSGSMNLTPDGHLLFVVNAGDNSVSSFRITSSGPKLVSHVSSGGILPISLTTHGNLLYTVNEESSNIAGWWFSPSGQLTPVPGSSQSLSTTFPTTVAAQIGFSPDGSQLVVTERGLPAPNGVIDTFGVNWRGVAGPAVGHLAPTPNPFGFAFDGPKNLLVTDAGFVGTPSGSPPNPLDPAQFFGSTDSFSLHPSGTLVFKGSFPSGGRAACWVVTSKDGRYAFVTNTLGGPAGSAAGVFTGTDAVATYAVSPHGRLTLLGETSAGQGFPGEEAISSDGRYLYVLEPFIMGGPSHIDVYKIGPAGSLTHLQATPNDLPNGVSGLGAS
ncbi:MAG TPA: beta-propeller fold lactonase family protein [Solirubrobacteraceae bacterium]|nr:beta-propeller fold lactonase family protein [Solirubrobacteraceae bacterium]